MNHEPHKTLRDPFSSSFPLSSHIRPAVAFLQDLRVQLDAEANDIIDNACDRSTHISRPTSRQGAA